MVVRFLEVGRHAMHVKRLVRASRLFHTIFRLFLERLEAASDGRREIRPWRLSWRQSVEGIA